MRFSTLALVLGISASVFSAPVSVGKRALTVQTYNEFQVSDGVAGDALAEVNAKFPVDQKDLASVSAADLEIISNAADISEQAEVASGGFNDAIAAAGGVKSAAGATLQIGKIKNKVLKLQTDVLRLQILIAQGATDKADQLTQQQTKLATNVALDVAKAGTASQSIDFSGSD